MVPLPHDAAASIPSGTITFAFTDIEGSTQRWDRDRPAMETAVRRHDALMREAIAAHHGYVFKTIGDAFCAAFSRPEDAVGAMFDAQRALGAEDFSAIAGLRVRAAIHAGTADERDRDYFGPAVNRVGRLLSIAHGGQVLMSGTVRDLVEGRLPPRTSLRDLGEHRLKDLSRPEFVYQLVGPDLIADFPPLRSLGAMPNNLPRVPTSFIGRESEVAEITASLEQHHIVTIAGSGGVGKTRTSLQVAANLLDGSGDGVWFFELAPLSHGELIPSTVASAMGLTLPAEGDQIEHLVRALREKRALLVFDNCEHLVEAAARVIAAIVRGCPLVTTLATSRQGLGIAGEATYRLPPLALPGDANAPSLTAEDASRYAAIALFAERARAADNRFALTDANARVVADICRRLDGIPLAIELAAARVKIMSPKQLHDRLDERFRVLTGGSRDHLPRQQTLRALIDWSHDLLDDRERTLFRRLGIFVDGFTLEGASSVASDEALDALDVFDLVASLVEKSLAFAEPIGDTLRYRLLESTRAYAAEKLQEAGERDRVASRHLHYLRDTFVELFERQQATASSAEKNAALVTELEGVRFALDDALARCEIVVGAQLLAAIDTTWGPIGLNREGIARIEAFIAAVPSSEVLLLAKLSAMLTMLLGPEPGMAGRALESATNALAFARLAGDDWTLALALRSFASAHLRHLNFPEADAALREAATIPLASARLRLMIVDTRALLDSQSGNLDAAADAFEQAMAEYRAVGDQRNYHVNATNLASVEHARGRTASAVALVRDVLPALRIGNDRHLYASTVGALAGYLAALGDLSGATEAAHDVIVMRRHEPQNGHVTVVLEILALVDALENRFARAARLAAYAESALTRIDDLRNSNERTTCDHVNALLDANLTAEERARLECEGSALTAEAAIALALEPAALHSHKRADALP